MSAKQDHDSFNAVRLELLGEAAERASHDPVRSAQLRAAMRKAHERVAMPRVAAEPTPIRLWAVSRKGHFGPVQPAKQVARYMRSEAMAISLGGEAPAPESVEQLAAMVEEPERLEHLLGSLAMLTLPVRHDESDAGALHQLMMASSRPADLETLINAAFMLEFAAAHVAGTTYIARLLTGAAVLWWGAGQPEASKRALTVALRFDPTWKPTRAMLEVLRHRKRAEWPSA